MGGEAEGGHAVKKYKYIYIPRYYIYIYQVYILIATCGKKNFLRNTLSIPSIPLTDASSLLRRASAKGDQTDSGQGSAFFMGG